MDDILSGATAAGDKAYLHLAIPEDCKANGKWCGVPEDLDWWASTVRCITSLVLDGGRISFSGSGDWEKLTPRRFIAMLGIIIRWIALIIRKIEFAINPWTRGKPDAAFRPGSRNLWRCISF